MADNHVKYISRLLHFFMGNRFSDIAQKKVQGWFCDDSHREEKDAALREYYDAMPTVESEYSRVTLEELKVKLGFDSLRNRGALLRRSIIRAAAVLIPAFMVLGGALIYNYSKPGQAEMVMVAVNDGIQREITLSDNTKVWLNQGAEIEHPAVFIKKRTVSLSGEAFFKVERDVRRPFIVEAGGLSVKVLGTEFNVDARPGTPKTIVTLVRGSIEVNVENNTVVLEPLDRLEYDRITRDVTVYRIVPDEYDWRTSKLNFERMQLGDIFRSLEKYYGIQIESISATHLDEPISLRLSGDEPVSEVMRMLQEVSGRFTYDYLDDRIVTKPINQVDK